MSQSITFNSNDQGYPTRDVHRPKPMPLIANYQFGVILFIATELMFFAALVSAFIVIKASASSQWAPPLGAMLPKEVTLINAFILLMSGLFMFLSARAFQNSDVSRCKAYFKQAIFLALVFVGVQGFEWVRLLSHGMTISSGIFGACFYLIVGAHAIHAFSGAIGLTVMYYWLNREALSTDGLWAMQIFWTFVVAVWPILYWLVYFK